MYDLFFQNVDDSMCGESHRKVVQNTPRRKAKVDEAGLKIAGCRHGLAQWAVNMYQGEIYGYAHYLQSKKMLPAGVKYFWEDIVCKYWKWAGKVGGPGMTMTSALSVMHAKAHKWFCQVSARYFHFDTSTDLSCCNVSFHFITAFITGFVNARVFVLTYSRHAEVEYGTLTDQKSQCY